MAALGTRKLKFKIASTDYTDSVSEVRITTEESDSDFVSFAEAAAGGARQYRLALTLKQDTAAASLWYYAWGSAGTEVACEVWPNGGTVASVTTPKFTMTAVVMEPDGDFIGGEANKSTTSYFTAEFVWDLVAKPVLVIA